MCVWKKWTVCASSVAHDLASHQTAEAAAVLPRQDRNDRPLPTSFAEHGRCSPLTDLRARQTTKKKKVHINVHIYVHIYIYYSTVIYVPAREYRATYTPFNSDAGMPTRIDWLHYNKLYYNL